MNQNKTKIFAFFITGALVGMLLMYLYSNYKIEKRENSTEVVNQASSNADVNKIQNNTDDISELTDEKLVINYVKKNHQLPDYYLTKSEARKQGWVASQGNLCDVLPGKAIGGDHFGNREKQLPKGASYYEADVNYNCGNRGSDRIVFTKEGDVWLTKDHYRSFEEQ